MANKITIFKAKKIVTMNPSNPEGAHIAVREGNVLGVGTQDAAYQIHMDYEMGSIECGKFADFAVLDESPLDVDPMKIKDIPVWGTVVDGLKFQAEQG